MKWKTKWRGKYSTRVCEFVCAEASNRRQQHLRIPQQIHHFLFNRYEESSFLSWGKKFHHFYTLDFCQREGILCKVAILRLTEFLKMLWRQNIFLRFSLFLAMGIPSPIYSGGRPASQEKCVQLFSLPEYIFQTDWNVFRKNVTSEKWLKRRIGRILIYIAQCLSQAARLNRWSFEIVAKLNYLGVYWTDRNSNVFYHSFDKLLI